ncbi:hypothetical protein GCM10027299_41940 [Larkinella ripae]
MCLNLTEMLKMTHKQRRNVTLRPIPSDKMPYLVRGMASTLLHLTYEQAGKRTDLIPQFIRTSLKVEGTQL